MADQTFDDDIETRARDPAARLPRRRRALRRRGPQLRGDRGDHGRQARHRALPHPPRPQRCSARPSRTASRPRARALRRSRRPPTPGAGVVMSHLGSRVSALLDGRLAPEEEERCWSHVHACHACRDLVEQRGLGQDPARPAVLRAVGQPSARLQVGRCVGRCSPLQRCRLTRWPPPEFPTSRHRSAPRPGRHRRRRSERLRRRRARPRCGRCPARRAPAAGHRPDPADRPREPGRHRSTTAPPAARSHPPGRPWPSALWRSGRRLLRERRAQARRAVPGRQVTDPAAPGAQDEEPVQRPGRLAPRRARPASAVQPEGVSTALPTTPHAPQAGARRPAAAPHAVRRAAGPVPAAAGPATSPRPRRAVPDPGSLPPAAAASSPGSPGTARAPRRADARRPDDGPRKIAAVGLARGRLPRPGRRHARRPRRRRAAGRARRPARAPYDNGLDGVRTQTAAPARRRQRLGRRRRPGAAAQHRADRRRVRRAEAAGATGSGFVLDREGHVVTNNHVVRLRRRGRRPDRGHRPPRASATRRPWWAAARSTTSPCSTSRAPASLEPAALGASQVAARRRPGDRLRRPARA